MQNSAAIFTGIVHGKTIELDQAPPLPDGLQVHVTVQPVVQQSAPGDGILKSAGAWAEDAEELDTFLAWNRQQRKMARPEVAE